MNVSAKRLLTVAVLTNPLVWFAVTLAVGLACLALGGAVLWMMYRYLRDEWAIPTRPRPVSPLVAEVHFPKGKSLFGVELPKPVTVTTEARRVLIDGEHGLLDEVEARLTPAACAQDEAPVAVRTTRSKAAKARVVSPKPSPAKGRKAKKQAK
jgi:hypothetical protein